MPPSRFVSLQQLLESGAVQMYIDRAGMDLALPLPLPQSKWGKHMLEGVFTTTTDKVHFPNCLHIHSMMDPKHYFSNHYHIQGGRGGSVLLRFVGTVTLTRLVPWLLSSQILLQDVIMRGASLTCTMGIICRCPCVNQTCGHIHQHCIDSWSI